MPNTMQFATREAFRTWLFENCTTSPGIWLLFGKKGGPQTLSPGEALEEALCFGWIDGQMKSIDETVYLKYFAQRQKRPNGQKRILIWWGSLKQPKR